MARPRQHDEEVSLTEAARRLGMTKQSLAEWADRPSAPVLLRSGRRFCQWPAFPIWYRRMLVESREKPTTMAEAEQRAAIADAELKEFKVQQLRRDLAPVTEFRTIWREGLMRLRAQMLAIPGRYADRTAGKATLVESQEAWEAAIRDLLNELRDGDSTPL